MFLFKYIISSTSLSSLLWQHYTKCYYILGFSLTNIFHLTTFTWSIKCLNNLYIIKEISNDNDENQGRPTKNIKKNSLKFQDVTYDQHKLSFQERFFRKLSMFFLVWLI